VQLLEILLLVIAVAAIVIVSFDLLRSPMRRRRERSYLDQLSSEDPEADGGARELEEPRRMPRLQRLLRSAGLGLGVLAFLALAALFAVIVFLAILSISDRLLLTAILVAVLAFYLPFVVLTEWGRWRAWRFEERLMDPVDFLVSALDAGENPTQALDSAAGVGRDPVKAELRGVVGRLNAGVGIEGALEPMLRRYDSEGVRLFAQTLIVKWRAGGDLGGVMRKVAEVLRERVAINLRLKSELAGVQIAAILIALLPYLLIPFFLATRPTWSPALLDSPSGPVLLALAVSLQLVGFLWLRRILRLEL
jgi:tight adherence protein B